MACADFLEGFLRGDRCTISFLCNRLQEHLLERSPCRNVGQLLLEHQPAVIDYHHAVTDLRDLGQDVRGQYNRPLAGKATNELADFVNLPRVKSDSWFVKYEY